MGNNKINAAEALSENEQMKNRLDKLDRLTQEGKDPFEQIKYDRTHMASEIIDHFDELSGKIVRLAGRIMSRRGMGKVSFCDLSDRSGKIQIFTRIDKLGEEAYKNWQNLDIGDFVGVEGEVMRTKRGEVSIRNCSYVLLAKALRPLPEKFHGLKDTDTRYRQRYLDLIMNPEVKESFIKRSGIIKTIRKFLDERNFLEVETPILNSVAGGANARPFITHHNALGIDLYLRIAPELYLKRLIVGGLERVYELGRQFRNEGLSVRHNPEFTMMEVYQAYTDYKGMMELTESMIAECAMAVNGSLVVEWEGNRLELSPPFERVSMRDAVLQKTGVDFYEVKSDEEAEELAKSRGVELMPGWKKGDIFNAFFEKYVEETLIQPTFVYDYPIEVSPLSKRKPGCPEITERFELFVNGKELANAYSELNNPIDQRGRFAAQTKKKEKGDEEASQADEEFCMALEYGMPPTGGLGIGIDRLTMMLTGEESIRDVLLFPTMKPSGGKNSENHIADGKSFEDKGEPGFDESKIDFSKVKVEPLFEDTVDFETFSKSDFRAVKVTRCEEVPKSKKLLKFTLNDGTEKERVILSGIKKFYSADELIGKTLLAICNLPPRNMMGINSEGMLISAIHEEDGEEKLNLIVLDPRIPAGAKMY